MKKISAKDLKKILDQGKDVYVVDIRALRFYMHHHIPGAINIEAVRKVADLTQTVLRDKDIPLIIYNEFKEDKTSEEVAKEIQDAGYKDVSVLEDGIAGWQQAGYPVQFGRES